MSFEEFLKFLSDRFGIEPDEIEKTNNFGDLGVDSLSLFNLITDIEEKFKIQIEVEDMTDVDTIKKMYEYIKEKEKK